MFALRTTQAAKPYHVLIPHTRMVEVDPHGHGSNYEWEVRVRSDPSGNYTFRFYMYCAFGGDEIIEIVNDDELQRRRNLAEENGVEFDHTSVLDFDEEGPVWRHLMLVKEHFLTVMKMGLFSLPPTI